MSTNREERVQSCLEAYALGLDPLQTGQGAVFAGERRFRLAINPEAHDVDFAVELSDDLQTWRVPEPGELPLEREPSCLRMMLSPEAPDLFLRVRYRLLP